MSLYPTTAGPWTRTEESIRGLKYQKQLKASSRTSALYGRKGFVGVVHSEPVEVKVNCVALFSPLFHALIFWCKQVTSCCEFGRPLPRQGQPYLRLEGTLQVRWPLRLVTSRAKNEFNIDILLF